MHATRDYSISHPFVVESEDIIKIVTSIRTPDSDLSYKAKCKDGLNRNFKNLKELLEFDNSPIRTITELKITSYEYGSDTRASITLSSDRAKNISVSISGEDEHVLRIDREIVSILSYIKPWYYLISKIDGLYFFITVSLSILAGTILFQIYLANSGLLIESGTKLPIFIAAVTSSSVILLFIAQRFTTHLFPIGTFAINSAIKQNSFKEK